MNYEKACKRERIALLRLEDCHLLEFVLYNQLNVTILARCHQWPCTKRVCEENMIIFFKINIRTINKAVFSFNLEISNVIFFFVNVAL